MSCNCKNISPNQSCCCPKTPTTTTTLSPEQLANQECTQVFGSSSIVYNHTIYTQLGIPDCLGIRPNPTITDIINAIVGTFPECITTTTTTQAATTTTSTTTTTHIPCVNGNCPSGYICVNGNCLPNECDAYGNCPSGYICVDGICEPISCEVNGDCPNGYLCIDGICQPNVCDTTVDCPSGYVCVNGTCLPACEDDVDCPSGYECIEGVCQIPCEDANCSIGFTCVDGICQPSTCSVDIDCPIGFICVNGTCQPDDCDQYGNCPSGYICVDGNCESSSCDTTVDCPSGYICINGTCVPNVCETIIDCPSGYICINGECQPNVCDENIDCPSGYFCQNGTCVPLNSPCNAYSLNVNANCIYQTYNNLQPTLDFEAPEPTCGNYLGNSVWFTLTVPASGQLVISLQAGTITDAAMTVYTGSCTSLTQIACSDDQSPSYMMPEVVLTGLTPGITLFVRVWSYGNQQAGTFGICAINPALNPCGVTAIASGISCVPTTTTTQAPVNVPSCGILYNSYYFYESSGIFKGSNLYYYNYNTNTSTLLSVPGATGPDKPGYLDIANTTNKLWFVDTVALKFIEYNISLSPWNAIFNQNIPFPTGFLSSGGLFAITNDILLVVNEFTGTPVVSEFYIPTGTLTPKFSLPSNRKVAGDILLTTNNKLIITTASKTTNTRWISQYNYSTYALEFEKSINISIPGPAISNPWGLFETGGEIYVMDKLTGVYRIDKNVPYAITYINTPVGQTPYDTIMGASQQRSCITESFIPTTTTTTTAAPTTTTTTIPCTNDCSCITFVSRLGLPDAYLGTVSWTNCETGLTETYTQTEDMQIFPFVCGSNPTVSIDKIDIRIGSENCGGGCNDCFVNCAEDWATQNLDTAFYANGDPIPQVTSGTAWASLTTGAWCYYANNTANGTVYGKLYNWYALNDPRGLALPPGYRLATTVDWIKLINCVGDVSKYLKTTSGWAPGSYSNGDNITGFSALPGGFRRKTGSFYNVGSHGRWWAIDGSSTFTIASGASDVPSSSGYDKRSGLSVRLIKI